MRTPLAFPPPPSLPSIGSIGVVRRRPGSSGDAVAGYEVVRRLGVSPTSEVLLAVSRGPFGFERTVVLKRLHVDVSGDAVALANARLGREALAYARLAHPAIVRLYDFVEDDGRLTLVLEHVDGLALSRVLSGLRARGEDLDEQTIAYVGYRLFQALAAAHSARDPMTREFAPVIHRDVSPANVLVPWDGYVKLTDFGVARLAGVASDTRPGVVKGTIGYLAPEQVRRDPLTVRTDVYAACLVMRELLLGEPVFPRGQKSELELLGAMALPDLVPLRLVPPGARRPALHAGVAAAIDRGLAPDPEARSVTAEELVSLFRSVAGDVDAARRRLADKVGSLRRGTLAAARGVAQAARSDRDTADASLFDESGSSLDSGTATATAPAYAPPRDTQEKTTSRPPPPAASTTPTSVVLPRARPVVSWNPSHPSAILPIAAPPETARMVNAPERVPAHAGFAPPASSALRVETPSAMTTSPRPALDVDVDVEREREPSPRGRSPRRGGLLLAAAAAAAAVGMGVVIGGVLGVRERATATAMTSDARATATAPLAPSPVSRAETAASSGSASALAARPAASSGSASALAARPAATSASALADSPAAISASAPGPAPTTGRLLTSAAEQGHRVFLDGRVVGSGGAPLVVRCGKHAVRVGSAGRVRKIDVPCGGDLEVTR